MNLHIVTPVSRPEQLPRVAESLRAWGDVPFTWHLRFDWEREHREYVLRNEMLDQISDGWVWFLDDDTVAHPDFYAKVSEVVEALFPSAVVVSQSRHDRGDLVAAPENMRVNEIDIGQAVIRRDVIADERFPDTYAGDGMFFEALLGTPNPYINDVVYLNEILSYHNALERPVRQ